MFLMYICPLISKNSATSLGFMYRHFFRKRLFLFVLALVFFCYSPTAAALSNAEMEILRMYYREKDLVVSATRYPKPISHIAENMAIVTAEEIEAMNAHTLAEILNRIPGLFVNFNQDFGATSLVSIQGSEDRHVLVLMNGIPWNFMASGAAETHSIPVGVIERIEIIKGPASSAWGSSLGGVINIITKEPGRADKPTRSLRASFGERSTSDLRGEVAGRIGSAGYYLFAGVQESDGLRGKRDFESISFYSSFAIPISSLGDVGVSLGYSQPETRLGDFPSEDIASTGDDRTFFASTFLDATLSQNLSVKVSFHHFNQKTSLENKALGLGSTSLAGERFLNTIYDEATTGGSGKLVWKHRRHTLVLGTDFHRGKLDQRLHAGRLLQSLGVPKTTNTHPKRETWALFANDTMVFDRWSLTPGIRYDHTSITGSFVSPSVGVTYRLDEDSIIRTAVARGFTLPPLVDTSGGALFLEPNPDLEPETVWSYQVGAETSAARYVWLKATFFYHELENALSRERFGAGSPTFNDLFINKGKIRRQGLELEAETVQLFNLSFRGGAAYVKTKPSDDSDTEKHIYNIGVQYDDKTSLKAQLFGHFVWWDLDGFFKANYDDFIWDLNLIKKIFSKGNTFSEVFLTAHNIFNGAQYTFGDSKNPQRWLEVGLRVNF